MTNKDLHTILLKEMDTDKFISNSLMNKIVIEHKDIKDNLYDLIHQGKVIRTSSGYLIKK